MDFFLNNSGDRTWQPHVSSQPILYFLEPWERHVTGLHLQTLLIKTDQNWPKKIKLYSRLFSKNGRGSAYENIPRSSASENTL